jgi:hypothetical protein
MTKPAQAKRQAQPEHDDARTKHSRRADEATQATANQLGATEEQITPLTPPTRDDASNDEQPKSPNPKQRAADEIDPADEITPG